MKTKLKCGVSIPCSSSLPSDIYRAKKKETGLPSIWSISRVSVIVEVGSQLTATCRSQIRCNNVAKREIDAESGPEQHEAAKLDGSSEN